MSQNGASSPTLQIFIKEADFHAFLLLLVEKLCVFFAPVKPPLKYGRMRSNSKHGSLVSEVWEKVGTCSAAENHTFLLFFLFFPYEKLLSAQCNHLGKPVEFHQSCETPEPCPIRCRLFLWHILEPRVRRRTVAGRWELSMRVERTRYE